MNDEEKMLNAVPEESAQEQPSPVYRTIKEYRGEGDNGGYVRDVIVEKVPFYAYDNGPTMEGIMGRAVPAVVIRDKTDREPREWGNIDDYVVYCSDDGSSKQGLEKFGIDKDNYFIPKMYADRQSRLIKPQAKAPAPQMSPAQETPTETQSMPDKSEERAPETVTRLDDGVSTALKQVGLSWKYLYKNMEKMFTKDKGRQQELQNDIDAIGREYDALPQTKGMAQLGAIGTNVVGIALPTVIAGALMSPGAAAAVGGALTALDMANTASQANMEIDSYERSTGNEVSGEDRAAYTTASVATDAIMNVLMGSKVLKNAAPGMSKALSRELKETILKNPVAQQEFNTMTREVLKNELRHAPKEIARNMMKSGVEGGVASGAMEAERSIYTKESPELQRVVTSVLGGFASGAVQGAVNGATAPLQRHQRRMDSDDVYYASDMLDSEEKGMPISEIEPKSVRSDGKRVYVEGEVSPSTGEEPFVGEFNSRNISMGSYRKAHEQGATTDRSDGWAVDTDRMQAYEQKWSDAATEKGVKGDLMRNEVVQGIAADMGVPVTVYRSLKEVPKELLKNDVIGTAGAVTVQHDGIYVVLDRCRHLTASNIAALIRHEAVGHYGLRKLYGSDEAYEAALKEVGGPVYDEKADYEEEMSLRAERRDLYQGHSEDEAMARVYELLRRSESNLRKSTINELRNSGGRRWQDYLYKDGNPMPTMYNIEKRREALRRRQ